MPGALLVPSALLCLAIGTAFSCSQERRDAEATEKIHRITHSLVEVSAPLEMFQPAHTTARSKLALQERMQHHRIPGVSIAVVRDMELDWAAAYGTCRADSKTPVTTETLFEAASTSKLVAALLAMRYASQGLLQLDANVNEQLRSWAIPASDFTRVAPVTPRLLLSHQSGMNRPDGGFQEDEGSAPTLLQVLDGVPPARNAPAAIEFEPGSQWQYSNFGYIVLQQLFEDLTGSPYARITQEELFDPLGLKDSTFVQPPSAEFHDRLALPHDADGHAHDRALSPTILAQGGLLTTPTDLASIVIQFMAAYQGRSERLLSQDGARQILSTQRNLEPDQFFGLPARQGLGVFLLGSDENPYLIIPGGNEPGSNCLVLALPALGDGAVIMANGADFRLIMEIVAAMVVEYGWPVVEA